MLALIAVALPGCELFEGECSDADGRWCDGTDVKYCESENGGGISNSHTVAVAESCGAGEMCVEWKVQPGTRDAECVDAAGCHSADGFCIEDRAAATCVEGEEKPKINACGDESFEGSNCSVGSAGAVCSFSNDPCSPDGSERCLEEGSRYALVCVDGHWSELNPCLVGESCYDLNGGEVACRLRVRE